MAYNASNEERVELASVQKNSRGEYIKVAKITNKNTGSVSVDVRLFYTNDSDEVAPTSKGVRFNAELLVDIMSGLAKALESNEVYDLIDELQGIADDEDSDESDDFEDSDSEDIEED
jgi:hypothetical protein